MIIKQTSKFVTTSMNENGREKKKIFPKVFLFVPPAPERKGFSLEQEKVKRSGNH